MATCVLVGSSNRLRRTGVGSAIHGRNCAALKKIVADREEETVLRVDGVGDPVIGQRVRCSNVCKHARGRINGKHFCPAGRNSVGALRKTNIKAETFGIGKQLQRSGKHIEGLYN